MQISEKLEVLTTEEKVDHFVLNSFSQLDMHEVHFSTLLVSWTRETNLLKMFKALLLRAFTPYIKEILSYYD